MQQSTPQTNQQDAKKLQQLIKDIESTKDLVEKEYQQKLNSAQDKIYNIFLLGPSGAGKSTIANELANVRIKFQSDDEETFNCRPDQNLDMMFKISPEAMISETDKPQVVKVGKEFQIIDLPGYFDCRCKYKDLKNIVYSQSLIRISEYSQICIVIPASQFYDYNLEKLIKIMNNIDKNGNEIELTLIISMVNGQKLEYFLKKLQHLLTTNKLQTGKELLEKIILQNRVILFDCPIQDPNDEDVYQFNQEKIRQIKQEIFRQQQFKKYDKIRLNPPDETKITLQGIFEYYHNKIRFPVEVLSQQYLRINIQQIICNTDEQQQLHYQETEIYNTLVEDLNKNIQRCHFFTQQFEQTKGQDIDMKAYNNIKSNIEYKIDMIFQDFDIRINNEYQSAERVNNSLYIKCIHLSANQLKQLLVKFSEIKNIFIFALLGFRLDSDLVLPGISLYVSTSYFICIKGQQLQINLKGTDGGEFKPLKAGQSKIKPQDGEEGHVGYEGQNGGNLFIDAKVFDIEEKNLTINVSGGNGGQGQQGGDGRDGKKGQDAVKINENNRRQQEVLMTKELEQSVAENFGTFSNTYERIYKSYGTHGEVGGNSGPGGQGGYGGRAGQVITIKKLQENIINIDGSFGQAGIDGIPGKGGQQGKSFTRTFKCVKAFGALRQHENLQQSQGVGKRVGVNMATFGVATVASVFGTAVKSLMKTQKWLNDGEYNNEDIFGENGKVNPRYYTRDDNLKSPEPLKSYEMQEFIKKSKDKLSSNEYMVRIQKQTAVIQKNTNQIQTLKFY